MKVEGKWAWITGAAGGIGSAMALELARRGANLVLTDLEVEPMALVAAEARARGAEVLCRSHDVRDRARWAEIAGELEDEDRLPVLLVNNAGVAAFGRAMDLSDESWQRVIDVDLWGVVFGCRELVPRMLASGRPSAVLNVASASAYVGLPLGAPYFIAKAGVLSLTQTLQSEIDRRQVSFTCLCPGQVATGIAASAARFGASQSDIIDRMIELLEPSGRTPGQVARRAIRGALAATPVVNVYPEAWLLDLAARVLPHRLLALLNRRYFMYKFPELVDAA